jgi:hypothetical protein
MLRPRRFARLALAAGAAALAACAPGASEDETPTGAAEPPPSPFCPPDAPRYHAFLASGSCADVAGVDGRWIARPLFPDAPPDVRAAACTYRWSAASSAGARTPDVAALEALAAEHLTQDVAPAEDCDPPTTIRGSAAIIPVDPDDGMGGLGAPTGVSGCDVCARLGDRSVFVILPADRVDLRQVVVATSDGRFVSLSMTPPTAGAQAFAVDLPPAPGGATYLEGRVPLFEAL